MRGSAATIANPTSLTTALASNPGDTVILVQATYKYKSVLSYVLPANFTLSQVVFAHPRTTDLTITCMNGWNSSCAMILLH